MQNLDIYLAGLGSTDCLSVPAGTDITTLDLPADHRPPSQTYNLFRSDLVVDPDRDSKAFDVRGVLRQIEEQGFALHRGDFVIRVKP